MTKEEFLKKYEQQRQPVESWTRVMGYLRNHANFNLGKKAEFAERKWFTERACAGHFAK